MSMQCQTELLHAEMDIDQDMLYRSHIISGSYLNHMLHCGPAFDGTIEIALSYLPVEILWENRENLAFIGTMKSDAFRVARKLRERELIVLSDHIFPSSGSSESTPEMRYFIWTVLHEVAHVVCQHRSPKFDSLTPEENEAQEEEADQLAYGWYNQYVEDRDSPYLLPITQSEVEEIQERYLQITIEKQKR